MAKHLYGFDLRAHTRMVRRIRRANTENLAWLRNLGAALVAVNGVGALLAARDPTTERNLYDVVMLAFVLEMIALGWSTITLEFSATKEIFVTGPLALAALVSIALIILHPKTVENNFHSLGFFS